MRIYLPAHNRLDFARFLTRSRCPICGAIEGARPKYRNCRRNRCRRRCRWVSICTRPSRPPTPKATTSSGQDQEGHRALQPPARRRRLALHERADRRRGRPTGCEYAALASQAERPVSRAGGPRHQLRARDDVTDVIAHYRIKPDRRHDLPFGGGWTNAGPGMWATVPRTLRSAR